MLVLFLNSLSEAAWIILSFEENKSHLLHLSQLPINIKQTDLMKKLKYILIIIR